MKRHECHILQNPLLTARGLFFLMFQHLFSDSQSIFVSRLRLAGVANTQESVITFLQTGSGQLRLYHDKSLKLRTTWREIINERLDASLLIVSVTGVGVRNATKK